MAFFSLNSNTFECKNTYTAKWLRYMNKYIVSLIVGIIILGIITPISGCSQIQTDDGSEPSSTRISEPTRSQTQKPMETKKPDDSFILSDDYSNWFISQNASYGGNSIYENLLIESNFIILHMHDLYSININTKEKYDLDTDCKNVQMYSDYIFYIKDNGIYKVKSDGTCRETIFQSASGEISRFCIVNDTIYYLFFNEQKKNSTNSIKWELHQIDLNGQNKALLQNCVYGCLLWHDKEHIYYIDVTEHLEDTDSDTGTFMIYDIAEYDIRESRIKKTINDDFDLDFYPVKFGQKFYYHISTQEMNLVEYDLESGIQKNSLMDTYILNMGTQYYQWVLFFNENGQSLDALDLLTNRTEKLVDLPDVQLGISIFADKNGVAFNTIDKERDYFYSLELINGAFVSSLICDTKR